MSLWRTETEISLFIYLLVSYKDFDFISIFFLVFHEFYFVEAYRKSPPHAASVITTHLLICEFLYKWVHVQYCIRITKPIKTLKGLILFMSSSANQIDWSSESAVCHDGGAGGRMGSSSDTCTFCKLWFEFQSVLSGFKQAKIRLQTGSEHR